MRMKCLILLTKPSPPNLRPALLHIHSVPHARSMAASITAGLTPEDCACTALELLKGHMYTSQMILVFTSCLIERRWMHCPSERSRNCKALPAPTTSICIAALCLSPTHLETRDNSWQVLLSAQNMAVPQKQRAEYGSAPETACRARVYKTSIRILIRHGMVQLQKGLNPMGAPSLMFAYALRPPKIAVVAVLQPKTGMAKP